MATHNEFIFGTVLNGETGKPLGGVRVQVGRRVGEKFTAVAGTVAEATGTFRVDLAKAPADLKTFAIRVYDGKTELEIAEGATWRRQPGKRLDARILVRPGDSKASADELGLVPDLTTGRSVLGVVRYPDGRPASGLTVKPYSLASWGVESQLQDEGVGASGTTDSSGQYCIYYVTPSTAKRLFIRVYSGATELGKSEVTQAGSRRHHRIDATTDAIPTTETATTEYAKLRSDVISALGMTEAAGDVNMATALAVGTFTADGLVTLRDEVGVELRVLATFVAAVRLQSTLGSGVSREATYGLLRAGKTRIWTPTAVLQLPADDIRNALTAAAEARQINATYGPVGATPSTAATDYIVALVLSKRARSINGSTRGSLGALLAKALPSESVYSKSLKFLELMDAHAGDPEAFWIAVAADAEFSGASAPLVDALKRVIKLGIIGLNYPDFVDAVDKLSVKNPSELAELDSKAWTDLVTECGHPDGFTTDAAYATHLKRQVERSYPSQVVNKALRDELATGDIYDYLLAHKDFAFESADIDIIADADLDKAAKPELKAYQRLFRIGPDIGRADTILALANGNTPVTSAIEIYAMGQKAFVDAYDIDAAEDVFLKAKAQASNAIATMMSHHPGMQRPQVSAIPMRKAPVDSGNDAYDGLFGSLDFCACEDCESVLSPAAYFVEVLRWLDERSALDTLLEDETKAGTPTTVRRRPDLGTLKLTCANTNTALPYIDLANEVMEDEVASVTAPVHNVTHGTTDELLVAPEYVNGTAYGILAAAVHAPELPFDRPLEEMRAFLRHLGAERIDLLRTFSRTSTPTADELAAEELGVNNMGFDLIADGGKPIDTLADPDAAGPYLRWGYVLADTTWVANLSGHVKDELMPRAQLTYEQFMDLLHSRFVNPISGGVRAFTLTVGDECDLSSYTLTGNPSPDPTAADFTRMNRFLRLWRATGWSMLTLDKVLTRLALTLGGTGASAANVQVIAAVKRLERRTGLAAVELAAWWSDVDTLPDRDGKPASAQEQSLYERTFLGRSVGVSTTLFALLPDRSELYSIAPTIADKVADLQLALRIDADEVLDILTEYSLATTPLANSLTLANLSKLYRCASLARLLGLTVPDARRLRQSMTADPFSSPADANAFLDDVDRLRSAGLSLDEVLYVLGHETLSLTRVRPSQADLITITGRLRDKIAAARPQILVQGNLPEKLASITATHVVKVVSSDAGDHGDVTVYGVPSGTGVMPAAERLTLNGTTEVIGTTTWARVHGFVLDGAAAGGVTLKDGATSLFTIAAGEVSLGGGIDVPTTPVDADGGIVRIGRNGAIASKVLVIGTDTDGDDALEEVEVMGAFEPGTITWRTIRAIGAAYVDDDYNLAVQASKPDANANEIVNGAVAEAIGVGRDVAAVLAGVAFSFFAASGTSYRDVFMESSFVDGNTDPDDPWADIRSGSQSISVNTVEALLKIATLVSRFDVSATELASWISKAGDGTTELLAIKTIPSPGSTGVALDSGTLRPRVLRLLAVSDLFRARATMPGSTDWALVIDQIRDTGTVTAAKTALGTRTGWIQADINTVVDAVGVTSGVGVTAVGLRRVAEAMALVRRFGVSAATVDGWVTGTVASAESAAVVAAARSRYGSAAEWATVARPIRDTLRERQRDALVAYLRRNGQTVEDLYGHLLIDIQMGPMSLTSRVKQAACSAQLYVERKLMGLESGGSFGPDDNRAWSSMRTYRVWEAARKIFLWPENWLDPTLRDDKTPTFKKLESAVQQDELNDDVLEDAMVSYLEGLHDVGNLEPVAMYHETDSDGDGDTDVLHIVSRSRHAPPRYYYRRREEGVRWTPWEVIEADVQSDNLVLGVRDRRLMLFWAQLTEGSSVSSNTSWKWWTIDISWSAYRKGTWSPARRLRKSLKTIATPTPAPASSIRMSISPQSEEAVIQVRQVLDSEDGTHRVRLVGSLVLDSATFDVTERGGYVPLDDVPTGFAPAGQGFIAEGATASLNLVIDDTPDDKNDDRERVVILNDRDDLYEVLPPAHYSAFVAQDAMLVKGRSHVYLAEPESIHNTQLTEMVATDVMLSPWGVGTFDVEAAYAPPTDEGVDSKFTIQMANVSVQPDDDDQDDKGFVLQMEAAANVAGLPGADTYTAAPGDVRLTFKAFYHPYTTTFLRVVRRHGIMGLLSPSETGEDSELARQALSSGPNDFKDRYSPTQRVKTPYPVEAIDFDETTAYGRYNWEVFFHGPWLVAEQLHRSGQYEQAMDWFHTIFDPRDRNTSHDGGTSHALRMWKVKPLMVNPDDAIDDWATLAGGEVTDENKEKAAVLERQLAAWRRDPFNPFLIARMRHGVFQRAIVMKYIDNLIAWGDSLFRQDTIEALNEATQLYVLAASILGAKPVGVQPLTAPTELSFNEVEDFLADGELSATATLIEIEQRLFMMKRPANIAEDQPLPTIGASRYFAIPPNPRLMAYWDTVGDRLFKIRHSLNIDGDFRQLPLFEPPIDPSLLIRARAAGVDLALAVSGQATLPHHRFSHMLGRAQALAGSTQRLGGALLSAIEKRDSEALSLMRSTQEIELLVQVRETKVAQIDDAKAGLASSRKAQAMAEGRRDYYAKLVDVGLSKGEKASLAMQEGGRRVSLIGNAIKSASGATNLVPDLIVGMVGIQPTGTSHVTGGTKFAKAGHTIGEALVNLGTLAVQEANAVGTLASYARRKQEWEQQHKQALKEVQQAEKQVLSAEIRVAITEADLKNHDRQVANARDVDDYMRTKFSNEEMYNWMVGELLTLHRQTYQFAYDAAKQAQLCYAHEVGIDPSSVSFVQPGAWDSAKKGLMSGERLQSDLERMEIAFTRNDQREFEITKHIALADVDPVALIKLRELGTCQFWVPEVWFDVDYAGHYFRRVQSVAATVSAVTGPIAGVTAELEMVDNKVRFRDMTANYASQAPSDVRKVSGAPTVIATSTGNNDGGVFSLDFRDPKYLPFERHGAVACWELRLTGSAANTRATFDWQQIGDVILTLQYTARKAGALAPPAIAATKASLNAMVCPSDSANTGLKRAFRSSVDFPDAWHAFLNPVAVNQTLTLPITKEHLPYPFRGSPTITKVELFLRVDGSYAGFTATSGAPEDDHRLPVTVTLGSGSAVTATFDKDITKFGLMNVTANVADGAPDSIIIVVNQDDVAGTGSTGAIPDAFKVGNRLLGSKFLDLIVVLHYTVG